MVVFSGVYFCALFYSLCLNRGATGLNLQRGKRGRQYRIKHTMGPGLAYLAAWTYWVVHIPYGAKAAGDTHCIGMGFKRRRLVDKRIYRRCLAGADAGIVCFLYVGCFPGMKSLKVVGSVAGIAMFIMSILYVVMAVTAPAITNVEIATANITGSHLFLISILPISPPSLCWSLRLVGQRRSRLMSTRRGIRKRISEGDALFSRHGCGLRYPRFVGDGNDV